jgi:DNA modification methylase
MSDERHNTTFFYETRQGRMYLGDSLELLANQVEEHSVDLILTSPPFGLVRKKEYGNVDADEYTDWFKPFARAFKRVLKENGSLVIDIGGAWIPGQPTRSLYHFKLLIMLCEEFGFHLAQEFYWWNPSKLPTPAEWVAVRRIRVKDAINCVWWLSPSPWPKASNRRVLQPYSSSMQDLLKNGYKAKKRPSGHDISKKFSTDNGAAIPPNLIALANTESNSFYLRYCKERNIEPHPARYPAELPEFFIRMLTDAGDLVVDPFAGSCVTGEVCERIGRRWICAEVNEEYLRGALGRFVRRTDASADDSGNSPKDDMNDYYRVPRPGVLWNGVEDFSLPADGGRQRISIEVKSDSLPKPLNQKRSPASYQHSLLDFHTQLNGAVEAPTVSDEEDMSEGIEHVVQPEDEIMPDL